ncbi:hypothetical protein KIN20_010656 [Parelaphostrongylus tenuis]|uniref:Uncharacterized protein n=1 Tax=Parelaphostrongylus tenuis TaxID=148309 RepID=A0AAD5MQW5_PARTN|nr:hypothetical protein KIN20_010656 [Parelaphostrongylus tenuis]
MKRISPRRRPATSHIKTKANKVPSDAVKYDVNYDHKNAEIQKMLEPTVALNPCEGQSR